MNTHKEQLEKIWRHYDEIARGWNGEDVRFTVGGEVYTEDEATTATEISEKLEEVIDLLIED